ncbi:MAG: IS30 family transposase [Clostridium sp.]|nr:IS30 family transposase [Clostridium sp.]
MAQERRSKHAPHNKKSRLPVWRHACPDGAERQLRKLPHGKNAKEVAKEAARLLYDFRLKGVLTITADNGSEFAEHKCICEKLKGVTVYFTDSYSPWQKGGVENTNKPIRQYIPKGTDFNTVTDAYVMKVQKKLNRRPREKLEFSTPVVEFFKHFK